MLPIHNSGFEWDDPVHDKGNKRSYSHLFTVVDDKYIWHHGTAAVTFVPSPPTGFTDGLDRLHFVHRCF